MRMGLLLSGVLLACSTPGPGAGLPDAGDVGEPADAAPAQAPSPPSQLQHWVTGDPVDAVVTPTGPGLFLAGGGADVDAGFLWMASHAAGGDMVVIRASGSDGYNDYLYSELGGFDSVETLLLDRRELADDPYVAWVLAHAEAIFIAGGDQWRYIEAWTGTEVQSALADAWSRGAIIGGTSAGCAVLGELAFSAENGTVYSSEALEDPFNEYMTLERGFFRAPPIRGLITDTHFGARDRMGRLLGFLARINADGWYREPVGLGIDEATALLVEADGAAEVVGSGSVYAVFASGSADVCEPGTALSFTKLSYVELGAGDSIQLPSGETSAQAESISVVDGAVSPSDPY
ncbi:MAG: cyanophycinase [Deltaproteobacteria bacterium]|nr:cyanophycinase [Deltaproteobacteria bacterium]